MSIEQNSLYIMYFDLYGRLLTDRQRSIFRNYYFDNFSLGEIGENFGITRQAVKSALDNAVESLRTNEKKLELHRKIEQVMSVLADEAVDADIKNKIQQILEGN